MKPTCPACRGRGLIHWHPHWDNGHEPCPTCKGSGKIEEKMKNTVISAEQARALLDGTTVGPWAWEINLRHKGVQLSGGKQTKAGGDLTVMSFERWGMRGAAPVFWTWSGLIADQRQRADALAVPAVGRDHHKDWFARIDHPDARLIAAAPDLAATIITNDAEKAQLTARIAELEAQNADLRRRNDDCSAYILGGVTA